MRRIDQAVGDFLANATYPAPTRHQVFDQHRKSKPSDSHGRMKQFPRRTQKSVAPRHIL